MNTNNISFLMRNSGYNNYNKLNHILINIIKDHQLLIKIKKLNNQVIGYKHNNKIIKRKKK